MGTPDFAVPSLQALYDAGYNITGVFTQPDRPAGRGNKITASPIKVMAQSLMLPVFQPEKIKCSTDVELIKKLEPECIVVVAYGQILPQDILKYPRYGCINVHASLLPAYRGAAPIHWAVINGEHKTGVTTMLMDEGLDTGDMLLSKEIEIGASATTGDVHDVLMRVGAEVLLKTLEGLVNRTLLPTPQPQEFTYAPLLKREHEKIDWFWKADKIHNRIRGLSPWPGAFTTFRGQPVKIWKSELYPGNGLEGCALTELLPGQIVSRTLKGIRVTAGEGLLEIIELQPAGKKRMAATDFFNGRQVINGELFV